MWSLKQFYKHPEWPGMKTISQIGDNTLRLTAAKYYLILNYVAYTSASTSRVEFSTQTEVLASPPEDWNWYRPNSSFDCDN